MKKIGVIFGGKSTEHDVSIVSGTSVIVNLDKNKYEIYPIYISKEGEFYKYTKDIKDIKILKVGDKVEEIEPIDNIESYLKKMDVIFPILHGRNGEDGTIQGLLEILNIPYVGCGVLSSSVCMDKAYTKIILNAANIEQAKYIYIKKYNDKFIYIDDNFNKNEMNSFELIDKVKELLKFPVFIKASNSGSSVGVNKCIDEKKFIKLLNDSFKYDDKVLIEEEIKGREVECAILGNDELITSTVGEVLASGEFYSYDSKYKNKKSLTVIPTDLNNNIIKTIQDLAKKAYFACDCSGLARIDFFIEKNTNRIILNEINTLPGFTEISMYPKLIEETGINYKELLDKLIDLAKKKKN